MCESLKMVIDTWWEDGQVVAKLDAFRRVR